MDNVYARIVRDEGNINARQVIEEVFMIDDRAWRGIGLIPKSGYELKAKYKEFNANIKFNLTKSGVEENDSCIAGAIMKGIKRPKDCPNFGTNCTPANPLGAPMVSSEGSCAAYYNYQ